MNTSYGDSSDLGSMHDAPMPMAISKENHSTIGAISNKDDIPSLASKQGDTPMLGGIGLREPIRFPTQQRDSNVAHDSNTRYALHPGHVPPWIMI